MAMKTLNCNYCIIVYTISSVMHRLLRITASLGIHIDASPLISVAPLNVALIRNIKIF